MSIPKPATELASEQVSQSLLMLRDYLIRVYGANMPPDLHVRLSQLVHDFSQLQAAHFHEEVARAAERFLLLQSLRAAEQTMG